MLFDMPRSVLAVQLRSTGALPAFLLLNRR